jgi:hypothetical protein
MLLDTTDVPSSSILFVLMMEAICFYETSFLTRATRRLIPEDGIVLICENLSSYTSLSNLVKLKDVSEEHLIRFDSDVGYNSQRSSLNFTGLHDVS